MQSFFFISRSICSLAYFYSIHRFRSFTLNFLWIFTITCKFR